MQTWVALFRGINVGGNNILAMKPLLELMTNAGCSKAQSYIQSGNVVFQHPSADKKELGSLFTALVEQHFGFSPKVLLVDATEFEGIVANNPFKQANEQPKNLHVFFLDESAKSPNIIKINSLKAATEQYQLLAGGFYLYAPEGIGRSKLAAQVEKCLGVATTARNLNTLLKIAELLAKIA